MNDAIPDDAGSHLIAGLVKFGDFSSISAATWIDLRSFAWNQNRLSVFSAMKCGVPLPFFGFAFHSSSAFRTLGVWQCPK